MGDVGVVGVHAASLSRATSGSHTRVNNVLCKWAVACAGEGDGTRKWECKGMSAGLHPSCLGTLKVAGLELGEQTIIRGIAGV